MVDGLARRMDGGAAVSNDRTAQSRPRGAMLPGGLTLVIAESIEALAAEWRALERTAPISPYQRFDFLAAWCRHAAAGAGVTPRVGVVRDAAGRVLAILPFGTRRGRLVATGHYLGGSHVNINMPLVDPAWARTLDGAMAGALLDAWCRAARADLLALVYQPESWIGAPHPFLALPRQPSSDTVRLFAIEGPYRAAFERQLSGEARSKLRRKEKRLIDSGVAIDTRATSAEAIDRLVPVFQAQKAKRLATMGADDPFSAPGIGDFLRDAARGGLWGEGGLELHGMTCEGTVIAVRGVVRHGAQLSLLMQSFDTGHPLAKYSLGEVLLSSVLAADAARGVTQVDFGVGDARYKDTWSNAVTPMFDIVRAATPLGAAAAFAARQRIRATRAVKQNRALYGWLKAMRARLAARKG